MVQLHSLPVTKPRKARFDIPVKRQPEYRINLDEARPDPTLFDGFTASELIKAKAVPWRMFNKRIIFAALDPDTFTPPDNLPTAVQSISIGAADLPSIHRAISSNYATDMLEQAQTICPERYSCRNFNINFKGLFAPMLIVGVLAVAFFFPIIALSVAMIWVLISSLATTTLRLSAIWAWRQDHKLPAFLTESLVSIFKDRPPLTVTLLVPLFDEEMVLPRLIKNLSALDYPKSALKVMFLLEESDTRTKTALKALKLSEFIDYLEIPKDWLQTKPKAMNYALPFCDGDIIGIYDAEDRPDTDQIQKVVNHFNGAPENVACVQGYLDFYNSRDNWIARCFTIEYSTWFRVLLKGIQSLNIPIPLGGTTVFFRREVLKKVGGWDAHNVTEDADLGIRLARFGYKTEIVSTTTWEEANFRALPWIRQRSRWLKGYAITWCTHMRDPARLYYDLGLKRFIGFHVVFLGGLSAFLAGPIFWLLWLSQLGAPVIPISALPAGLWWLFAGTLALGQFVMLGAMVLATWRKSKRHLIPFFLALPFYWPMGTIAVYKAIAELVFAPFYWDKTPHGISQEDQEYENSAEPSAPI